MGPLSYTLVVCVGLMVFAAVHYGFMWLWSRREPRLLTFAAFAALAGVMIACLVRLLTTASLEAAQFALNWRTTSGLLCYALLVALISDLTGLYVRWFSWLTAVVFVAAATASAVGIPINGTITALHPTPMAWGEVLNVLERTSDGWLVAPLYALILGVHGLTVLAGLRSRHTDRLASVLLLMTAGITLTGTILAVLVDVVRVPIPLLGGGQFALWVPALALLLSRDYARRDERLIASEARYRTLIESAPEAIVVLDLGAGRFVDVNQKAVDLFGWPSPELLRKTPLDISPERQPDGRSSAEAAPDYIRQAVEGGTPNFEWTHTARDGREIPCEVRLVRLPDPDRVLVRGSIADISAKKQAEAAMRDIESRHSAILESSLDGLIVVDVASRIVEFNSAAEAIFGHRREGVIGRDLPDLLIPASLRESHRESMRRFVETGEGHIIGRRIEMPALRADGSEVHVELSVQPIAGTTPPLFAGVVRDITERLRLEEQLRQSQKMEAMGQLAGGVAHDFNNLLTVISGYCGMLLERLPPGDPRREDVTAVADAGQRAAALTQRLLAFSHQAVLTPRVVDINDVVRDTEQILRRLIGEDILLTVELERAAGRVKVDAGHLGQALINLALNARDALPAGGRLTIETSQVEVVRDGADDAPAPGRYACVRVRDNGTGMTPEVRARVFEPFFTTKGVGRGTGLGLAVVHGIVRQSQGSIQVESEPGRGSTFTIRLPIADEAAAAAPVQESDARVQGTETILLVEDEAAVRGLLARSLRSQGFCVLTAGDGVEALRLSQERAEPIDLLATDVVMPNMSGRDLADRLRKERAGLKVLFMSGYTDDTLLRHGIYEAREAFLQKPFPLAELAAKVRGLLDQK